MMSVNADSKTFEARNQIAFHALEELVLEDHLLRKIDRPINFSFNYALVEDVYCLDSGRPSFDPITLIKISSFNISKVFQACAKPFKKFK
ncbi:hypothetical protein [Facklamia sp. P13055]|uniref:hypothetical protein n=1 Tax=unclassified Facklamia TaxID=2622293 RepID=UPI003D16C091